MTLDRRIRPCLLELLAACAALGLLGGLAGASPTQTVGADQVVRALLDDLAEDRAFDPETLLDELLAAGLPVEQDLLQLLEEGGGARGLELDPALRSRLVAQLDRIPRLVAARIDAGELGGAREHRERALALRVLERRGAARDLEQALALGSPADAELPFDARLARQLEHSLAAILSRDLEAWEALGARFRALDPRLHVVVLRAVSEAASPPALEFLGTLLGRDSAMDVAILAQLGKVGERIHARPDERTRSYVQACLASPEVSLRRDACLVIGRLQDDESTGEVLQLLLDEDPGVAQSAGWALQRLTGEPFAPEYQRWKLWYERELSWWREQSDDVFARLRGPDRAATAAALREIAGHRLYRHDLAREVARQLSHPDAGVAAQACAVLGVLRSWSSVPELERLRDGADGSLREHAEQALARIRG